MIDKIMEEIWNYVYEFNDVQRKMLERILKENLPKEEVVDYLYCKDSKPIDISQVSVTPCPKCGYNYKEEVAEEEVCKKCGGFGEYVIWGNKRLDHYIEKCKCNKSEPKQKIEQIPRYHIEKRNLGGCTQLTINGWTCIVKNELVQDVIDVLNNKNKDE